MCWGVITWTDDNFFPLVAHFQPGLMMLFGGASQFATAVHRLPAIQGHLVGGHFNSPARWFVHHRGGGANIQRCDGINTKRKEEGVELTGVYWVDHSLQAPVDPAVNFSGEIFFWFVPSIEHQVVGARGLKMLRMEKQKPLEQTNVKCKMSSKYNWFLVWIAIQN